MAIPVLVKVAVSVASDKRLQKILLSVVCSLIAVLIIILSVFSFILSGLIGFVLNANVYASWNNLMTSLEDVFSGIQSNIGIEIKNEVYTFMPDFSVNLSKANISANFGDNILLTYDTGELELAYEKLSDLAYEIRDSENIPSIYADDNNFMNNTGDFHGFSDEVKADLYDRVRSLLTNYNYEITEYTNENGQTVTTQTLTVYNGDYRRIVEYVCTGGGTIYVPHFMALYQTRQSDVLLNDTSNIDGYDNPDELEEDLGTAFSELPDDSDEISDDYNADLWSGIGEGFREAGLASMNFLERNSLARIFENTIVGGEINVWTEYDEGNDFEKLTVYLETPGQNDWYTIFGLDESHESYIAENERIIVRKLNEADIPEDERYLSLDNMVQLSLFQYFQGFFNLPVESTDLKSGTNGILSAYGEIDPIHLINGTVYRNFEQGVTLNLNRADIPVKVELLPVGDCIESVMIYDVFDANDSAFLVDRGSYTYNYCSVKIAYEINLRRFEEIYGFPFPTAIDSNGIVYRTYADYLIFIVEYSCLDRLNRISKYDIGKSLYDVYSRDTPIIIGYAHNGYPSEERGDLFPETPGIRYHKLYATEPIPHVCIKTSIKFGYLPNREYLDSDYSLNYSNPNNGMPGADLELNPILWFKPFRTDLDNVALDGLMAIAPK